MACPAPSVPVVCGASLFVVKTGEGRHRVFAVCDSLDGHEGWHRDHGQDWNWSRDPADSRLPSDCAQRELPRASRARPQPR